MAYRELPEDLLQAVNPQDLRSYALAKGWKSSGKVDERFAVLSHPCADLDQVLIPLNVYAPDYGRRIGDAVQVLAERENRPALEVLNDLLLGKIDNHHRRISRPRSTRRSASGEKRGRSG